MNNDDNCIYDILSKFLGISTEAARDFVHQVNEYLPYDFPPEVIYSSLLRTLCILSDSTISRMVRDCS